MMKIIKSIFEPMLYLFLSFLIIVNFISIFTSVILKQEYTNIFGYSYFEIASNSMYPELKKGDLVIIKLDYNEYKVGDVITFKDGDLYTTHRLSEIDNDSYTTKGDANNSYDDPITKNNVIGKVAFKIPSLGALINIIKNPVVIVIGFLLIICFAFIKKDKKINEGVK